MFLNDLKRFAICIFFVALIITPIEFFLYHELKLARSREAQILDRSACAANLEALGRIFQEYSSLHGGSRYPPYPSEPGGLMVDTGLKFVARHYSGYEGRNFPLFWCPQDEDKMRIPGEWIPPWYMEVHRAVDDLSYFYLAFALYDDKDVGLFADEYRKRIRHRRSMDDEIELPEGVYAYEGIPLGNPQDRIYRMRPTLSRFLILYIDMPTSRDLSPWGNPYTELDGTIPVLVERPENHETPGGHVLYMDGHVEFIPYPGSWPMTEQTIAILNELDAMGRTTRGKIVRNQRL